MLKRYSGRLMPSTPMKYVLLITEIQFVSATNCIEPALSKSNCIRV